MGRMICGARWCVALGLALGGPLAVAAAPSAGPTSDYSGVVVIGDSLSDVGNIDALARQFLGVPYPPPPNAPGRFSNGPVWVDYIGAGLGHPGASVPFLADPTVGTNYAFGGAAVGFGNPAVRDELLPRVGPQLANALSQWGMTTQVLMHLERGGSRDNRELYVVWGGANDFWDGGTATDTAGVALTVGVDLLLLHAGGMRHVLVPNLPPLGSTPRFLGSAEGPQLNGLVEQYNRQLDGVLDVIDLLTSDLTIHRLDVHGMFLDVLEQSGPDFNVTTPAFDGETVVGDPNRSLFWDEIHPTGVAHAALGTLALSGLLEGALVDREVSAADPELLARLQAAHADATATVPEPVSSASLLTLGCACLILRRRPATRSGRTLGGHGR